VEFLFFLRKEVVMNTYNENLQQTVINTLSALSLQQANLDSLRTIAESTLYQAQGAEFTARDKLRKTAENVAIWQHLNEQSLVSENQIFNLLSSATKANADVTTCMTNSAAAASNVQIASNAIAALAADVGAALNIATASLYDTDVYNKIMSANSFINEVANESKNIAKDAMNASSYASEITSTEVLSQTQALKSKIDNIFKSARAQLSDFSNLAIAETGQLVQASQAERQAEGELRDTTSEVQAIETSYSNANKQLNYGLGVQVVSGAEIKVSFTPQPTALPPFNSSAALTSAVREKAPNYYLTLLPTQNQSTFSLDQAQQLFAQRDPLLSTGSFTLINVHEVGKSITEPIYLSTTTQEDDKDKDVKAKDVFGNPISVGSSYVAYLYIELPQAYKQFINNFSDVLSAPTASFVPATTLPVPTGLSYAYAQPELSYAYAQPESGLSWATVLFDVAALYPRAQLATAKAVASTVAVRAAEEEALAAKGAVKDALTAAASANKAAAAAAAMSLAADADATQKATAAAQASAKAQEAMDASVQAKIAVEVAAAIAETANAAMKSDPNPVTKAAAETANTNLTAARAAEAKAIVAAAKASETADAAAQASTAAAAVKTAADKAKAAADDVAADAATAKVAAEAEAVKAAIAESTAKAAAAVESAPAINPIFANAGLEYRCILTETNLDPNPNFLLCEDEHNNPPIYFNLSIAEQVSPANYTKAELGQSPQLLFEVEFAQGVTDNFGNAIQPNTEYKPYILAVANGANGAKPAQFVNILATSLAPIIVCQSLA
jgi:hypothetical protein